MKRRGYWTNYGYLGLTLNGWVLFVSENEYLDYLKEE